MEISIFIKNIFMVLICTTSYSAFAINWGHLVTGTTEVLSKGQSTVGTVMLGHGISDNFTLGISPMAYYSYDFYSLISRYKLYSKGDWQSGFDFWYFKSVPEQEDSSPFSQESIFLKLNGQYKLNEKVKINMSYGYQKFYNEDSPYSLRPDPLGKERVFAIKGDDPYWYEQKLEAFDSEVRSSETHSISVMPTYYFNDQYYLNIEVGVLGLFYWIPLTHLGASINSQTKNWDISLGLSQSTREDAFGDAEVLTHTEVKIQYNF